ncbi:MAG: sensor histidine kinase, partial [Spirochaetales bacterium]|nr:sensor histidine kinase [Spirochaetales bacterium]
KQIWINLISNSLKFISTGGKISVTVKGDSPLEIVFRDDGAGIDSADLPNIFERFYKGDSGRNKKGSGLGLSIVKEIVDLHNGEITAESINMKGTRFTITLPGTIS